MRDFLLPAGREECSKPSLSLVAVSGSVGSVLPIIAAFEAMFVSFEMDSQKLSRRIDREDNLVLIACLRLGRSCKPLTTLPERCEGGPQLLNEQVGLFKGSKVTTPIKLIPVDQV